MLVAGAGRSAKLVADILKPGSVRVIAINRSYELFPWAEVLYAADSGFWREYRDARTFKGWRYSADESIRVVDPSVTPVTIATDKRTGKRVTAMIREPVGVVGFGGNSGFQAVNLAAQFGASRILLCLDYCGGHWHPDHSRRLRNPVPKQLADWARDLDRQAECLAAWGIEVLNVAPNSALKAYRHADCGLFNSNECTLQT